MSKKLLVGFTLILVITGMVVSAGGCARIDITSDPPGADIYAGPHPDHLTKGGKTPWKQTVGGLYFVSPMYYQLKKEGYEDSGMVFFPARSEVHAIRATLQPVVRHKSSGTGFAVSKDGLIVTAYHLINDAKTIRVYTSQDFSIPASVLHSDPHNDLALLKIESPTPHFLQIAPMRSAKMGDKVFTIGFPVSSLLGQKEKYSDGVISALSGLKDASSFQIGRASCRERV